MATDEPYLADLDRLANIVDHRNEEPDIEYKSWMNLSDSEYKSKLAKHLCALANYGGGWIVFGIADDGTHAEPHPVDLKGYSQDIINGIVSRYLTPSFHCNVYFVTSTLTKKKYPIVRVPPHGAQPVCAKTDGPLIDKRRVGVTQGVHYIRTSGPKSIPIDRPELWKDVLHRCVLAERSQLLSSIGRLFEQPTVIAEAPLLDRFVDASIARWNELQESGWPVDPVENKSTVSFQFLTDDGRPVQPLPLKQLLESVRDHALF
jgi:Putative DNA-binding domain